MHRERNRETIDDLKGKLNASESENELLKAKLDAVRKWASNPVRIDEFGYQMAQESVLAILDGEEKYHAD